ncbi:putative acetyltransferase [Actinacidiphila alni]|uniref:Putative acetyltransferase n=1 Tax=Actinacidiphila alni TaxID=380248 RepID=A0A1I2IG98_9ACTN|nr:N-acetyltransferase [Actinacidiphila alni]SFF40087.1 putative acetyltransferase [Actinacidiphila alni]
MTGDHATEMSRTSARRGGPEVVIRREREDDLPTVRRVHTAAFAAEPRVADLTDVLRSAPAPLEPLSLVAVADGEVVGHVLLSASRLDAPRRIVDVLVLSPLGVLPEFQHLGIGTRLVSRALAEADESGAPLLFLEGSPDYYSKRGFKRADEFGFRAPSLRIPAPAFQVAPLSAYEPWMTGTLVYSDPFWAMDCVGLRDPADLADRDGDGADAAPADGAAEQEAAR